MANGNDNFPDIFDRPIPGQSLTDEPKNYLILERQEIEYLII